MTELSDADVFGSEAVVPSVVQKPQGVLSDAEVFGPSPSASPPVVPATPSAAPTQPSALTDEQVGVAEPPSILDYLGEVGKRFVKGATETVAAAPLRGYGARLEGSPEDRSFQKALEEIQGGANIETAVEKGTAEPVPARPVTEHPLYKAGEAVTGAIESALPDKNILNPTVGDVASGFGSVAGNIAATMIPVVGPGVAALSIPGAGMGEAAERAVKAGATPEQQQRAATLGTIPGATDFVDALLPSLGTPGKIASAIKRFGLRVLEGAFVEGGQEGLQQFFQNLIAKGVYKPDQNLGEDVAYNALIGAIVGGATTGIVGGHGHEPQKPPTLEQIQALIEAHARGPSSSSVISLSTERIGARNPTFYSNVARAIEEKLPNSADGDQVIKTLRGTPGVREEEIHGLQLPQYLFPEGENGRVRKADLLDWANESRIRVHEIVRSEDNIVDTGDGTSYIEYRPPGPSKNYTELLLTLGDTKFDEASRDRTAADQAIGAFRELMLAKYTPSNMGGPVRAALNLMDDVERAHYNQLYSESIQAGKVYEELKKNLYTLSHWKESNVIAHVRFDERRDASGQPLLLVSEMQSDWAQQARKYGFKGDEVTLRKAAEEAHARNSTRRGGYPISLDAVIENLRSHQPPPLAHFSSTKDWTNLVFKRILREAADRGHTRVAWVNGDLAARYSAGGAQDRPNVVSGLRKYYDEIVPSVAKGWAKKLGGTIGQTRIATPADERYNGLQITEDSDEGRPRYYVNNGAGQFITSFTDRGEAESYIRQVTPSADNAEVMHIDIPQSAWQTIQRGLPLFKDEAINPTPRVNGKPATPQALALVDGAKKIILAIRDIAKRMGINEKVSFEIHLDNPTLFPEGVLGHREWLKITDHSIIRINIAPHNSVGDVYSTLMHEFGHVVKDRMFAKAPLKVQLGVAWAYEKFLSDNKAGANKFINVATARDNAARVRYRDREYNLAYARLSVAELTPAEFDYHLGLDEFFAEQIARWATSSEVAATHVEKFFQGLGRKLREVFEYVSKRLGLNFRAAPEMEKWLDSFLKSPAIDRNIADISKGALERGRRASQNALGIQIPAVPPQGPAQVALDLATNALGATNPTLQQNAAFADRMNWVYKWMAGLDQLGDANPHFTPILNYRETTREMHLEEAQIHDAALRITKDWQRLGPQADNLTAFLNDLAHMAYRTPQEVARGVERQPSSQEVTQLATKHQLSGDAIKVSKKIKHFMDTFLKLLERSAIEKAQRRITDPAGLMAEIMRIQGETQKAQQRPYFPFMWFGDHFLAVRDAAGNLVHFETFERSLFKGKVTKQQARMAELQRLFPNHDIRDGVLPESASHLVGMPPLLLSAVQGDLQLTPDAIEAIKQIRHGLSPTTSFRNAMQYKANVPGYSMDFRRSFARYAFHGARYYSKTRHIDTLKSQLEDAQKVGGVKASKIAQYMAHHFQNTVLDAKGDFALFKGAIFLWAMGYVPAAATQNLSQTPMITLPFLGAKFGDIRAVRAIVQAITDLSSFYKRGKYDNATAFELRALGYGIKTGRVSETQAPELAGISQGAGLLLGAGGNKAQRFWSGFQEKAAWMFEMAEQFNRRIAYRAALKLAMADPNAKGVREAMTQYASEYQALLQDFTPAEARAIVTANHVVDKTQYVYAREMRPRFMQGRWGGTLFVFKKYMQSTLFMLAHNKGDVLPRYLIVAAALGGLGGVPGYDDFRDLLRLFVARVFGKDFNLDRWVREHVRQFSPGGAVPPDLILHGLARYGLGLPALLDMLGSYATGRPGRGFDPATAGQNVPFPTLDRSRALSMGTILPFELGKTFMPTKDVNATIAEQTQKASGAVFSVGFNMYKAIMDSQLEGDDQKRWERAVPRLLGAASKAFRTLTEGRERFRGDGKSGSATFLNYDWRDPEQAMELAAMAMGYQPLRAAYKWDAVLAEMEIEKFWDLRRTGLLGELHDAAASHDEARRGAAVEKIQEFNKMIDRDLPYLRGKKITSETANKSLQKRELERAAKEAGVTTKRTNAPILDYVKQLYPGAIVDVRKVQ